MIQKTNAVITVTQ